MQRFPLRVQTPKQTDNPEAGKVSDMRWDAVAKEGGGGVRHEYCINSLTWCGAAAQSLRPL